MCLAHSVPALPVVSYNVQSVNCMSFSIHSHGRWMTPDLILDKISHPLLVTRFLCLEKSELREIITIVSQCWTLDLIDSDKWELENLSWTLYEMHNQRKLVGIEEQSRHAERNRDEEDQMTEMEGVILVPKWLWFWESRSLDTLNVPFTSNTAFLILSYLDCFIIFFKSFDSFLLD